MKVLSMNQVLEKCLNIGGGQLSLQLCVYPSDGPVFTTRPCVQCYDSDTYDDDRGN